MAALGPPSCGPALGFHFGLCFAHTHTHPPTTRRKTTLVTSVEAENPACRWGQAGTCEVSRSWWQLQGPQVPCNEDLMTAC